MEDDLFYDWFGNDGFLTPKSSRSDQDSGHGSPFESPFNDVSPTPSFAWDGTNPVGDLWGSILDDLPSDITDGDSVGSNDPNALNAFSPNSVNCNDVLSWSTQYLNEGPNFVNDQVNFEDNWNLHGNGKMAAEHISSSMVSMNSVPAADSILPPHSIELLPNMPSPESLADVPTPESLPSENDIDIVEQDLSALDKDIEVIEKVALPSTPMPVKPITAIKAPAWVVKTADLMTSHFQLGQNIVAIIQNVNSNASVETEENIDVETIGSPNIDVETVDSPLAEDVGLPDNDIPDLPRFHSKSSTTTMVHHSDHDYADVDMSFHSPATTGVSQGVGPGLTLTDEEKKLLEIEGLKLPEDAPLTKEEEKCLKKVRRKIKNKQSAMESRRKRKEYIDNLERRVKHCTDVNNGLRKKVDKLSKENKSLVSQLKAMKEFIGSFQDARTPTKGTCLAVLVLSFALFVLPFNPVYYFNEEARHAAHVDSVDTTPMWRSRSLLGVVDDNTEYHYQDEPINSTLPISNIASALLQGKGLSQPSISVYQPSDENLKVHFEPGGEFGVKWNSSMLMYQNVTWYSTVNSVAEADENGYATF